MFIPLGLIALSVFQVIIIQVPNARSVKTRMFLSGGILTLGLFGLLDHFSL